MRGGQVQPSIALTTALNPGDERERERARASASSGSRSRSRSTIPVEEGAMAPYLPCTEYEVIAILLLGARMRHSSLEGNQMRCLVAPSFFCMYFVIVGTTRPINILLDPSSLTFHSHRIALYSLYSLPTQQRYINQSISSLLQVA